MGRSWVPDAISLSEFVVVVLLNTVGTHLDIKYLKIRYFDKWPCPCPLETLLDLYGQKNASCPWSEMNTTRAFLMRLIRLPEVLHKVGLCRSQVYNMCDKGTFPKPVSLGTRTVAWNEDEIHDWMMSKIRQRDARSV